MAARVHVRATQHDMDYAIYGLCAVVYHPSLLTHKIRSTRYNWPTNVTPCYQSQQIATIYINDVGKKSSTSKK